MKKSEKTQIEKRITNILKTYNSELSFRFRTTNDSFNCAGIFLINERTAVSKCHRDEYELTDSIAHEMAHAIQWAKTGDTSCWTENDGKPAAMKAEHNELTEQWKKDLQFLGFLPKF